MFNKAMVSFYATASTMTPEMSDNCLHINIENEARTRAVAASLAPVLRAGDVITLQGPLGAGKTAFARALIRALTGNAEEEVPSPTFTLVQTYDTKALEVWHFDLYRLEQPEDVFELGWDDARRGAAALIEWPERLGGYLPSDRLEINISFDDKNDQARRLSLIPSGSWQERLKGITL